MAWQDAPFHADPLGTTATLSGGHLNGVKRFVASGVGADGYLVTATESGVLVLGTSGLLTHMASCCKPAPPDPIVGFITRGKGISIHRTSCKNFAQMCLRAPERIVQTEWGAQTNDTVYPVDVFVLAGFGN